MDIDLVKSLIEALEASSLMELEYSADGTTLRLVKSSASATPVSLHSKSAAGAPVLAMAGPAEASVVVAPLFGVVHLSPSPGLPHFVAPGKAIVAGEVLCLIEAMKTFTQLRAEQDGIIAEVLVRSGQDVEAGQALFRLE